MLRNAVMIVCLIAVATTLGPMATEQAHAQESATTGATPSDADDWISTGEETLGVALTPAHIPTTPMPTPTPAVPVESHAPWWTQAEAELLARLLYAEARGEPREGQIMVAQCVLDRLESGLWGDTITRVIYAPGQFAAPGKLTDALLEVAVAALEGERAMPEYSILYFRCARSTGAWYAPYITHYGPHACYGYERHED